MLEEVLNYLNNWFECDGHEDEFTVSDNSIELSFLQEAQYFRVNGSVFNDGLHQYPDTNMVDEEFDGTITALAIPPAVIELSKEIDEWESKYKEVSLSPYQSESFGGYSYNKGGTTGGTGSTSSDGWRSVFKSQLSRWKKI